MQKNQYPRKILNFLKARYAPRGANITFSESGEDIIIKNLILKNRKRKLFYIDIGAHHPVFGNNTFLFYKNGGSGINIEPNEQLCKIIRDKRPRDKTLAAGVGGSDTHVNFYAFPQSTRSTFSKEQAEAWEKTSGQKPHVTVMPLFSLDTIVERFCEGRDIDVVSIDAEGYDIEILSGYSWKKRPKIFCIESLMSDSSGIDGTSGTPRRNLALYSLLKEHNYFVYAETPANTIFVDTMVWKTDQKN